MYKEILHQWYNILSNVLTSDCIEKGPILYYREKQINPNPLSIRIGLGLICF